MAKSKVQAIIDALGKDNASGLPVTRLVDFVVERCSIKLNWRIGWRFSLSLSV